MIKKNEIATINKRHWEKAVNEGAGCTRPNLDLDIEAFRAYRERKTTILPKPHCDDAIDRVIMKNIQGRDVLCLGAGGGQQSAVYSLLGAKVTVFDLAEGQIEGDKTAAAYYGYDITTIQGDMRDLSCFENESFDLVHGMGMAFVPDARPVYAEVARVMRTGGLYRVNFTNPAVEFMDWNSWDGKGYRIALPYSERSENDGNSIQFRHYMSEIFNGLIDQGFSIKQVEDMWLDEPDLSAPPGTWAHWLAYIVAFVIIARKE